MLDQELYFNVRDSRELVNAGVRPDAALHSQRFIEDKPNGGWGLGDIVKRVIPLEEVPPAYKRAKSEWYNPLVLKP